MSLRHRAKLWLGVLAIGGATVWAGEAPFAATAHKRSPHLELRSRWNAGDEIERWFIPGPLGHEPGGAPTVASGKAYLSRVMVGTESADGGEWGRDNGLTEAMPFSHNLASLFPVSLFDSRPDYFPWRGGGRWRPAQTGSINWNPDLGNPAVAERVATEAIDYFQRNPGAVSFAVGVNDGLVFGDSPETLAWVEPPRWFRGRPDFSNLVYQFTNRVAAEVGRTHPDKFIGSLAYYWCEQAPDFSLEPNVLPFLTADRSQGYSRAFRKEERTLQRAWAGKGANRLGLYDYSYGQGFLIPRLHTRLLAENIKDARRRGFTDYYAEQFPNWGLDGPQPWLVAQLLQNPEASRTGLLDEYYRRYFKEAATPMRRFFERCEEQWMRQPGEPYWLKHWRSASQASLFPSAVCRELRALLDEAGRKASSEIVRQRIALVADSFAVTETLVAMVEARDSLERHVLAGFTPRPGQTEAWLAARKAFEKALKSLQQRHPLALHGDDGRHFLAVDPAYAAFFAMAEEPALPPADDVMSGLDVGDLASVARLFKNAGEGQVIDIERDGSFEGALKPEQKIGSLLYEGAVPEGWTFKIEPAEGDRSRLDQTAARTGARGLRMEGAILTRAYQWRPVNEDTAVEASVWVRGKVGVSSRVHMSVTWLDEKAARISVQKFMQLPEGYWPDWTVLRQGMAVPTGAKWVGVSLTAMNQGRDDWVEWDDVRLRTIPFEKRGEP